MKARQINNRIGARAVQEFRLYGSTSDRLTLEFTEDVIEIKWFWIQAAHSCISPVYFYRLKHNIIIIFKLSKLWFISIFIIRAFGVQNKQCNVVYNWIDLFCFTLKISKQSISDILCANNAEYDNQWIYSGIAAIKNLSSLLPCKLHTAQNTNIRTRLEHTHDAHTLKSFVHLFNRHRSFEIGAIWQGKWQWQRSTENEIFQ